MKINKLLAGLLVLVVLVVHPTQSNDILSKEDEINVVNAAIPALAGIVGLIAAASPAGPFLLAGLGFLHVLSVILLRGQDDGATYELTRMDLYKTQQVIMRKLESIDAHISESTRKIIDELSHTIESYEFFENMRNDLETLNRTSNHEMPVILNPLLPEITERVIDKMIDYQSDYRQILTSFITKYINPTIHLPTSERIKLFFDFILQKDELLARENQDCNQDSLHYKIYKTFVYLSKILTDSYVTALSAHVVRYQTQIRQNKLNDATGTKTAALDLLDELKTTMKELMAKTKWALENSSREIKNCGSFNLVEGLNFERLPFATILPRFYKLDECALDEDFLYPGEGYETDKNDHYETRFNSIIPRHEPFQIYRRLNDESRPFSHIKYGIDTYGHETGSTSLYKNVEGKYCGNEFYPHYKINTVGISTHPVCAKYGNVITGVRFRVRKNVLYIDIQQGKWLSELQVEPGSEFWTETPEHPEDVRMLSVNYRKIEIADHTLDGQYMNCLEFRPFNFFKRNDMFKLFLGGVNTRSFYVGGASTGSSDANVNEILLEDRDDPEMAPANVNRLISVVPEPKRPAYIKFQVSDFKKDLGRTTIPYIDTREVVTRPASPVVGIGIYHEAAKGDGGLLALKLISPSLTKYIDYSKIEALTQNEQPTQN